MSKGLYILTVSVLLVAMAAVVATAAPLAQLSGPADWKAWKVSGDWKWTGDWVGGAGTDQWRYAEVGSAQWTNYQVDLHLRLDTPSAREGAKWEAGNWTWAAYRNNVNAPDYEAGLGLRKQGDEMYRVMFSLRAQEVVLWSSRGGFLQVVPVKLEAGRDYAVRALARGPVAIDAELARVRPLVEEGGFVAGLDHSIPPDVPFANYRYYMTRLREMIEGS